MLIYMSCTYHSAGRRETMMRIHYSWIILAISFFSIITAGIIISSAGIFIDPFEKEFGWERTVISLSFAISLFFVWHIWTVFKRIGGSVRF